jgi:2-polyprenyl-3-methyl-5-hydroxy-6-metoxy-1,4-benzoquinol methylase
MRQSSPIPLQQKFWNHWNASTREQRLGEIERRQAEIVCNWLREIGRNSLDMLEVGCGAGWLCPALVEFGCVTATDLSDQVLERAKKRVPSVKFIAGDFMALDFGAETFDVVVSLEVLSHVADQAAFLSKISKHLRAGGHLMLATQNRDVLERFNTIPPPKPGQLRHFVDSRELQDLLEPQFEVLELFSVTPLANRGFMRIVNSYKLNRALRVIVGTRVDRFKEKRGWGWTLMALARKTA